MLKAVVTDVQGEGGPSPEPGRAPRLRGTVAAQLRAAELLEQSASRLRRCGKLRQAVAAHRSARVARWRAGNVKFEPILRDEYERLLGAADPSSLAAAAAERRRIARDLHDGAQQRMAMLLVGLKGLAEQIEQHPATAVCLVTQLADEAQTAVKELRGLVHGLQPPVLTEFGLEPALKEIARSSPLPVKMIARDVGRYAPAVEDAVYFTCREALQNTIKHAAAATARSLTLIDQDQALEMVVYDNGPGFTIAAPGVGFASMHDRIESLGGELIIHSVPGMGTRVHATVPVKA